MLPLAAVKSPRPARQLPSLFVQGCICVASTESGSDDSRHFLALIISTIYLILCLLFDIQSGLRPSVRVKVVIHHGSLISQEIRQLPRKKHIVSRLPCLTRQSIQDSSLVLNHCTLRRLSQRDVSQVRCRLDCLAISLLRHRQEPRPRR